MNRRNFLLCCGTSVLPRFERPDTASDEGGLWAFMEREEQRLRRSTFLIREPALNEYVSGIACRLAGAHCTDVRVYLVRVPLFNAAMAPNGMMQIWSGLLLRMANEAQLAAILAHEIGHYLARHGIDRLRDAKSRSAFGQLISMALSPAAFVGAALSSTAHVGLVAGGLAYARAHEREADRIGLELMAGAGYAVREAAAVWTHLEEEGRKSASLLIASHAPAAERSASLAEIAATLPPSGVIGTERYRRALAPHRAHFLQDEVQRRRFAETMALFQRLLRSAPEDGELRFFIGEAHRLRGEPGDLELALHTYRLALMHPGTPAEVHRSIGLVLRHLGRPGEAASAFARYLELRPNAVDAELVRTYL